MQGALTHGTATYTPCMVAVACRFGAKCTKPPTPKPPPASKIYNINWVIKPYKPMTAAVGDTVSFAWGGSHNVYLHPSGSCNTRGASLIGTQRARKGTTSTSTVFITPPPPLLN